MQAQSPDCLTVIVHYGLSDLALKADGVIRQRRSSINFQMSPAAYKCFSDLTQTLTLLYHVTSNSDVDLGGDVA